VAAFNQAGSKGLSAEASETSNWEGLLAVRAWYFGSNLLTVSYQSYCQFSL
jgi:hypothetical protein